MGRNAQKSRVCLSFLILVIAAVMGSMIALPASKARKKTKELSVHIPPLPTPPIPLVVDSSKMAEKSSLTGLTTTTLMASVALFIESQSIELLVEQLRGITPQAAYDFLQELIKRPRAMDTDELIQVAYGLISFFMRNQEQREHVYHMLDFIYAAPSLQERPPLLVIAAHSSYPHVIPVLLHWAKARHILIPCINDSLTMIAHTFDTGMLKKLEHYGVTVTPERATYMLWQAVQVPIEVHFDDHTERMAQIDAKKTFIDFLIFKKAHVNYHEDGYTMLIQATKHNDVLTIEQLLRHGADANLIVNDTVGSALQNAIINDFIDAELMLRQYHAQE